jgi:hypothetical protein
LSIELMGDETMKVLLKYRPDLRECELEDRLVPAIPDLGAIVLTPGGYVVVSHLPGIAATVASTPGAEAILTSFLTTASVSISSLQPGTSFGLPSLDSMGPTGANVGTAVEIIVGSGADDASAYINPPVRRNTIADNGVIALSVIGRASGDQSAVLPSDQVYRGGLPVAATVGFSQDVPGQRAAQEPAQSPVDPLPLRLGRRPHRFASGGLGNLIRWHADRAP